MDCDAVICLASLALFSGVKRNRFPRESDTPCGRCSALWRFVLRCHQCVDRCVWVHLLMDIQREVGDSLGGETRTLAYGLGVPGLLPLPEILQFRLRLKGWALRDLLLVPLRAGSLSYPFHQPILQRIALNVPKPLRSVPGRSSASQHPHHTSGLGLLVVPSLS